MATDDDLWANDDDACLSEHAFARRILGDTRFTGRADASHLLTTNDAPAVAQCGVCNTELRRIPTAGWRHMIGFRARDGCNTPWPR